MLSIIRWITLKVPFLDPAVRYQKLAGHDLKIIVSNPSGDRNYYLRNKHANLLNHYKNNYYFLEGEICCQRNR
jgi:hypothetical protein